VAVVCDGENAIFYVDSAEKSRGAAKGKLKPNAGENFKLGQGFNAGRYFRGQLSDVRIYPKALSPAEVAESARISVNER
jgi:hypothetical protein